MKNACLHQKKHQKSAFQGYEVTRKTVVGKTDKGCAHAVLADNTDGLYADQRACAKRDNYGLCTRVPTPDIFAVLAAMLPVNMEMTRSCARAQNCARRKAPIVSATGRKNYE
jgi:hypothetical protein